MSDNAAVTRQKGARFGSVSFVTGALDAVPNCEAFLDLCKPPSVLVIYGADTPPRSRAEMGALTALPGIESQCLNREALGLHEEYPEIVADRFIAFLR